MESLAEYRISQIVPKIVKTYNRKYLIKKVILGGFKVVVNSLKLQTFKKSIRCAGCGLVANKFILERDGDRNPHLNMYFEDGKRKILFTMDHIIPLSKGGPDSLKNTQTMCEPCNAKKKDNIDIKYFNDDTYGIIKRKNLKLGVVIEREKDSKGSNSCKCLGHGTRRNDYIW